VLLQKGPKMSSCGSWCNQCGVILSVENAYVYEMLSGKKGIPKRYLANVCKPCKIEHGKIRYNLEKKHPRPPAGTPCDCCGRIDRLNLDHDWGVEKFRGYICKNCNVGIGHLSDSQAGIERALKYLKKANGRSDEDATGRAMEDEGLSLANPSLPLGAQERFEGDNEASENILGRETEYNIA
jgi:hypothetical protein